MATKDGVQIRMMFGLLAFVLISMLSFNNQVFIQEAKLSVLITSLIAGILGYLILDLSSRRKAKKTEI